MGTTLSAVRERPILFSAEMVRAILDGRKTQTRRVVKNLNPTFVASNPTGGQIANAVRCPYGQPGDRLWVRETWAIRECGSRVSLAPEAWPHGWPTDRLVYRADLPASEYVWNLRPSIHMPRWASRLTLEITDVRVQRVQDITRADVDAEGVSVTWDWQGGFRNLWDKLNAQRGYGWDANPWVWALTFTRVEDLHV